MFRKHKLCAEKVLPYRLRPRMEIFFTYFDFNRTDHHVDHQIENVCKVKCGIVEGKTGIYCFQMPLRVVRKNSGVNAKNFFPKKNTESYPTFACYLP